MLIEDKVLTRWFILAISASSFVAAFYPVLSGLWLRWNSDADYGYALLVPVISMWLIWQQRDALSKIEARPVSWALYAVIATLLFVLIGTSGSLPTLARFALPLFILSSVLYLRGFETFFRLLFPLGFLFFMLPLPAQIQGAITPFLQYLATLLGSGMLELLNYPVSTRGNLILVSGIPMNVAEACSGLRYIFPLVGVGMLYSYLFETIRWKKIVNVLMAIPIAILMNALRIALTGVLMERWGIEAGTGIWHDLEGVVVLISAFFLHFLFSLFLKRLPPTSPPVDQNPATWQGGLRSHPRAGIKRLSVVALLLTLLAAYTLSLGAVSAWQLQQPLASFPLKITGWVGKVKSVPERITEASGAEEAFNAHYFSLQRKMVDLYIGYQGAPFKNNASFFHSPSVCLPSSGWRTLSQTQRKMLLPTGPMAGREFHVNEQLSEQQGQRILTMYWFQNRSAIDASALPHQVRMAGQAMLRQPSYDLFLRIITTVEKNESTSDARQRLSLFIESLQTPVTEFFN